MASLDEDYVRSVPDEKDQAEFRYSFELNGKAVTTADDPDILEDGDLIISGWAADFTGEDRQGENFTDGAFKSGIKAFMEGPATLCYHHRSSLCLGKVLELEEVEGKGLRMKARVDGAIRNHPELGTYYNQIKKGTLSALSCGGFFGRKMTPAGPRIGTVDMTEISITPVPCHVKPAFSVVAGKALDLDMTEPVLIKDEPDLTALHASLDALSAALPEGKAAAAPKGDYQDLHVLALIIALEQMSTAMPENPDGEEDAPGYPDKDAKVDALVVKTKECLDDVAKEAHALAAKLGPLPRITWVEHPA
jgi:HK97 family phage prohead protease